MTRFASGGYVFSDDEPSSCPADAHAVGCPCPVGGDVVYRDVEPGDLVIISNPGSCFRGATGVVESRHPVIGTLFVRGTAGWLLPFGASEVAHHGA